MAFKFVVVLTVVALVGVKQGSAGHAHSFAHFHGPVEGPGHEVVVHDKHGYHHGDYIAHPKYEFAYGIEDHHTGDYHSQKEHRDGHHVAGEYTIKEPGGNVRTVKYYSNPHGGFFADVHNSGGNDHSGYHYGGHHHGHDHHYGEHHGYY
ncbi:cuticle protein-like [Chelonus insularis]|uniref:cuticle protein-like n=1 Tax=Chelonus insularis TaxID=460826 RepID=UPI001589643D|nr:cuticle protein-like [Chelonus insularis]